MGLCEVSCNKSPGLQTRRSFLTDSLWVPWIALSHGSASLGKLRAPQGSGSPGADAGKGLPLFQEGGRRRGSCHLGCRLGPALHLAPSSSLHSCSPGRSPSFPSLALGSLRSLSSTFSTLQPSVSLKTRPCCSKSSSRLPSPSRESPHFFSSLLPPFYSKNRTEIRSFL